MIRSLLVCLAATTLTAAPSHAFDFLPLDIFKILKVDNSKKIQWTRMEVPGAQCGNGETYPIFISNNGLEQSRTERSKKIMFMLQGGGVCFSKSTCKGVNLAAPDKVIAYDGELGSIDGEGLFTTDTSFNKFKDYTMVYMPYCTGDVYIGRHEANYDGMSVRHFGQTNIDKSINHIKNVSRTFDFTATKDVVLYGFSAGAIGALNHITGISKQFPSAEHKSLISDAPGLHFSETFWHSFSDQFIDDANLAFSHFGYKLNRDNGLVAEIVPKICKKHRDWNIGVLQATMDVAMIFYGQHQNETDHHDMVLSDKGIAKLTENPNDNCSSWVEIGNESYGLPGQEPSAANSFNHTYLISNDTSVIGLNGVSAMDYAVSLTHGRPVANQLATTDRPDHAN